MIIYVNKKDFRSYGFTPDLWGGNTLKVEVQNDFNGGGKYYDNYNKVWVLDPPYEETEEDKMNAYEADRKQLLEEGNSTISLWQSELLLGIISDEDKEQLTNWVKYIKDVQRNEYPNAWPTRP